MSRTVPASMEAAWRSPAKIGPNKPVVRATIQRQNLTKFEYDTAWAQGGSFERDRHVKADFTSIIFGDPSPLLEIPNIITCSWERSIGQDAATCTITLMNSEEAPLGAPPGADFDRPGHYTYSRPGTGWENVFVPDMCVKTYEGYGTDPTKPPALDPFLMPSGVWLIDKVTYTDDGMITLEMRDLGRLLLDQITFPPAVPFAEYPLTWVSFQSRMVPSWDVTGGEWLDGLHRYGSATSSNELYIGKGLTNEPFGPLVSPTGSVDGFNSSNPIADWVDTDVQKDIIRPIWRSAGQDNHRDFVWWEYEFDEKTPVAALRLRLAGGPFRVYVSIHNGTKWLGKKRIDYDVNGVAGSPGNVDINADIRFVRTYLVDRFYPVECILPRGYNAKKIRLTFSRLEQFHQGEHPFRAGLREMKVYTADSVTDFEFERGERMKLVGNYGDYTHIVKWVTAWAGWYWPSPASGMDFIKTGVGSDETRQYIPWANPDPAIVGGRVWGDLMRTGTTGVADLGVDMFDKKPMMDIINYVRDLVGFNFFIDESGGVVWRMPNLWEVGNYTSPGYVAGAPEGRGRYGRTSNIVTLSEDETLLSYETTLDSSNIRERIFVANAVGGIGTVIKGYNPFPVGFRRVAGWSDQNFKNKAETRVMAEMIAIRQMFSYRTGRATIPGYPGIQVDDQVRIVEKVTNETYYHYVMGIKSEINLEEGTWEYDLQTHWLGEDPDDLWVLKTEQLSNETKQYLAAIGYLPANHEDNKG